MGPVKARYRGRFCPPAPKRFRQNAGFSCGTVRSAQLLVPMLTIALLRQGNWKWAAWEARREQTQH
jgi:hypothetical protein